MNDKEAQKMNIQYTRVNTKCSLLVANSTAAPDNQNPVYSHE